MKSALLEIQPTGIGDQLSWFHFQRRCIKPATDMEKLAGLTVQLTDAITNLITVCRAIDPEISLTISSKHGLLYPNFIIVLESDRFRLELEKTFSGGGNRENIFNFRVKARIRAEQEEMLQLVLKSYRELGPRPLRELRTEVQERTGAKGSQPNQVFPRRHRPRDRSRGERVAPSQS